MKVDEYIKKVGREFIIRICNYDLRVIADHLVRETVLKAGSSQLSNQLKKFKTTLENMLPVSKHSPQILEIKRKLREQ